MKRTDAALQAQLIRLGLVDVPVLGLFQAGKEKNIFVGKRGFFH
jgi:hypothetical protein